MLNRTELKALCKLLDPLTEVQAENAIMYSLGATQAQIAEMRHVTTVSVKKSLDQTLAKLDIYNLSTLRQVVLVRIFSKTFSLLSSQSVTEGN